MSPAAGASVVPPKLRRITRACDRCHRRGVKCSPSPNPSTCAPCAAFRSQCTYDRPNKRRGPIAQAKQGVQVNSTPRSSVTEGRHGNPNPLIWDGGWRYQELASAQVIEELCEVYYRVAYPIFPYFHWPTFISNIRAELYRTDRAFFSATMAVCAMGSARLRDGVPLPSASSPSSRAMPASEVFYDAAVRAIPHDKATATYFDYKRAKAVLAVVCIQYGFVRALLTHLGDCITLCAEEGFHDEARWPFWAVYQLDVYASITWGGIIQHRESQSTVLYPAEVYDDEEITPSGIVRGTDQASAVSFLRGWNFTTDLYRIMENALARLRVRHICSDGDSSGCVTSLFTRPTGVSAQEVLSTVMRLYDELPSELKVAQTMTGRIEEDRFGFEAANILVTIQTMKMVMAGTEAASVSQRCAIAGELLDALAAVPTAYIQSISSPMLHHLAGIGHLLGSVIQEPLSQWTYLQVRNVLLAMANLLDLLESDLTLATGISARLKAHISRIDLYMSEAALELSHRQVIHNALPPDVRPSSDATGTADTSVGQRSGNMLLQPAPSVRNQEPVPDWTPSANVSPCRQFQLPDALFADWPFDIGQGQAFDFLGDWQGLSVGGHALGLDEHTLMRQ